MLGKVFSINELDLAKLFCNKVGLIAVLELDS
jgi:hypothetical protein